MYRNIEVTFSRRHLYSLRHSFTQMQNIIYNASPTMEKKKSESRVVQQKYIIANQFVCRLSSTLLLIGNSSPGHRVFQDICACTCEILYSSEVFINYIILINIIFIKFVIYTMFQSVPNWSLLALERLDTEIKVIYVYIEATNRANSITSRKLVISACFGINFVITYSTFHKHIAIRNFSSNININ